MRKESYAGLSEEQRSELEAFDKGVRGSATKLGLARKAIKNETPGFQGKTEMEKLMLVKYREFFKLYARLSEESQEALINKASDVVLTSNITEKEFLGLMADLNRYALSLAPEDDPEGEQKQDPKWQDELKGVVDEMQRLKAERKAQKKLNEQEKPKGSQRVN